MVRKRDKHRVAQVTEQWGDYFFLVAGVLGFASVVGALVLNIYPDVGSAGLIDPAAQFWTLNGHSITNGAALASLSAVGAYGTNQALDAVVNAGESWKETEAAAFAGAAALPVGYEALGMTAASGEPWIQTLLLGAYGIGMAYIVDL